MKIRLMQGQFYVFISAFILIFANDVQGQTTFWTETFGTGCNQGQAALNFVTSNGQWTQAATGPNDAEANEWFISATENGYQAGICSDGCDDTPGLINRSLHVGNVPGSPASAFICPSGDCGALYDAGIGFGNVETHKRIESPTINCTGYTSVEVNMLYIHGGDADDYGAIDYFDGTSWSQLTIPIQTNTCATGSIGIWSALSFPLPSSADNNPNIKVGFQWINNDDGFGTDPSFAVDSITITGLGSTSVVGASFNSDSTSACIGSLITYSDLSTGNPTNWQWTFQGGTPATSTAQNPTVTYAAAGMYDVTLVAYNASDSDTVVVNDYITIINCTSSSAPDAQFTASDTTLCTGQCIAFTDNSTNSPSNWLWSFPGATPTTSSLQNPTNICYNTPGTYTVTLGVANASGADSIVKTNYITVANCPAPVAVFSATDTTLCIGDCIAFTDQSTGNPSTWSWQFNGATPNSSSVQNPTGICYNTAGSYTVRLIVSNASGSDTVIYTALVDVASCTGPQANFAATSTNVCAGQCIGFVNQSSGATSYQWTFQGGTPATSTSANPSTVCYATAGTYDVQLIAFNGPNRDTLLLTDYITVTNCPVPNADFTTSIAGPICRNTCIDFFDASTNIPTSWTWYFPGATPDSSHLQNPTNICYGDEGLYDVILIATNAFGTDTLIRYSYIEVRGIPGASINDDTTMFWGNSYQLIGGGGIDYVWTPAYGLDDDSIQNPVATPLQTTTYTVTISDALGCTSERQVTVTILQKNNVFIPTAFNPDGNPDNQFFTILGNNIFSSRLTIYDRWGEFIFESTNRFSGWDGTYKGEKLNQGIYTYVATIVYNDGKTQTLSGSVALIR